MSFRTFRRYHVIGVSVGLAFVGGEIVRLATRDLGDGVTPFRGFVASEGICLFILALALKKFRGFWVSVLALFASALILRKPDALSSIFGAVALGILSADAVYAAGSPGRRIGVFANVLLGSSILITLLLALNKAVLSRGVESRNTSSSQVLLSPPAKDTSGSQSKKASHLLSDTAWVTKNETSLYPSSSVMLPPLTTLRYREKVAVLPTNGANYFKVRDGSARILESGIYVSNKSGKRWSATVGEIVEVTGNLMSGDQGEYALVIKNRYFEEFYMRKNAVRKFDRRWMYLVRTQTGKQGYVIDECLMFNK